MTLLLVSGLPLDKPNSFSRQLKLLEAALKEQGSRVILTGPSLGGVDRGGDSIDAALLLGYTDQFNRVKGHTSDHVPLFLWAQFSRPPDKESLSSFIPVPLTEQTVGYLQQAGLQRIEHVIPHGIDLSQYYPVNAEEKKAYRASWGLHDGFVVGTVGAHTRRKRLDLVIQTISHLKQMGLHAQIVIKTDRVQSLDGDNLKEIARQYGMEHNTHLITGEMNGRELRTLYGCMDIYLNLSEWEGFCIPIVEALACGTPVCCPPLQGPGEIVPYRDLFIENYRQFQEDGSTLCKADPRDAARVIYATAEKPSVLKTLGEAGVREARSRYDIVRVARQWLDIIKTHKSLPL
jgi:glycosyltransferase involved in cell wall biosynthesis